MKQKKYLRLLALLLLGALSLSGCGLDGGVLSDRVLPILTALDLPEQTLTDLPEMAEAVDQSARGESASLMISETAGDGTLLYIVYAITVPDDWEQLLGNGTFRLSYQLTCGFADPVRGTAGVTEIFNLPQRYDPRLHTLYYLAAYAFSEPYTGQELSLQVEELRYIQETIPTTLPDVLTVSWTPNNQAPQRVSADGGCTITPLGLIASVPALDLEESEDFEDKILRPSLCLRHQDGTVLQDAASPEPAETPAPQDEDRQDKDSQQEDGQEADSQRSVFWGLSADWDESSVTVCALAARGTLFQPEAVTSAEVLGTTFSMEQP